MQYAKQQLSYKNMSTLLYLTAKYKFQFLDHSGQIQRVL